MTSRVLSNEMEQLMTFVYGLEPITTSVMRLRFRVRVRDRAQILSPKTLIEQVLFCSKRFNIILYVQFHSDSLCMKLKFFLSKSMSSLKKYLECKKRNANLISAKDYAPVMELCVKMQSKCKINIQSFIHPKNINISNNQLMLKNLH